MICELSLRTSAKMELQDITEKVKNTVKNSGIKEGICLVFVPHTTAAVTINENADPSVKEDLEEALRHILPREVNYKHLEGNSEAHILSTLVGVSLTIPVIEGKISLGTWQGIYFCEFDGPRNRKVMLKII